MKSNIALMVLAGLVAVSAANAGDLLVRGGVHNVDPKSGNDLDLDVKSNATLSIGATWFVTQNIAIDVLGALPFKHDIDVAGTTIATVKQLPPIVSVQYHFNPAGKFDPYVGAGVNVTLFFDEKITAVGQAALSAALETTVGPHDLKAGATVGPAVQLGCDFAIAKDWVLGVDLRWAKIGPDVKLLGAKLGTLDLDPLVYGVTIGRRFSL
jgi:outer membrane protein